MTTTIPCVDTLQNCDVFNYTRICDRDGVYATWAKQNCRAYCGYCTGKLKLFLSLSFFRKKNLNAISVFADTRYMKSVNKPHIIKEKLKKRQLLYTYVIMGFK